MKFSKLHILVLVISGLALANCKDMLEPENDYHITYDRALVDPAVSEGFLMNAYIKMPTLGWTFNEVATDDAVTNIKTNSYLQMAVGMWSAINNQGNIWTSGNEAILYLNSFLTQIDLVTWSWNNPNINAMFKARLRGEAYALRAYFRYQMLVRHGGKSASGQLLGVQLFNEVMENGDNFNVPRAPFKTCIDSIYADFNRAMTYLPLDYLNLTSATQIPEPWTNVILADYNKVWGQVTNQRISKRIILGLKSKVAILAASAAFNPTSDQTLWMNAANAAADVLNINKAGIGIAGLDPNGFKFYLGTYTDAVSVTSDSKEMLWRAWSTTLSNTLEKRMYPPGLQGDGEVNPTQNLVDAFPAKNGYPVSNPLSGYVATNPYVNRDPRLDLYIVRNGATMQSPAKTIKTGIGGGTNGKDSISTSTRTGYYMRKLLREDAVFNTNGTSTTKKHYNVHIRYTEIFLNYAEAANEAWGPTGVGTVATYSAKDVVAAIRKRAGITQPDAYLNTITTKEAMRDLIRNERRLELCFEGHRFWDMRRWGLPLDEAAKGVNIDQTGTSFNYVVVEPRKYQPYMQYGPIPATDILKYPAIEQNAGW
jgi:hypothetical protein